ncbi:NAD(P)-dependent oxidoreductase [Candidatus Micrarchaeota archaeon]|nr:NAD(P)-dependent oxidoreductase [Candidatus Micrarchaeota archaeon]
MKELFVTGATGRLGRRFVAAAIKKGYEVTALVRNTGSASVLPEGVELVKGDISTVSADVLREGVRGKSVVHLAAAVDFTASAEQLWDANVEGTKRIVKACEDERVKRLVYMSSTSLHHHPAYMPIDETQIATPSPGYGETKFAAEKMVKRSNVDYVCLRAPAIYGPGFEEGFRQIIDLVAKRKMMILGSGKNHLPLIHVDDLVQALSLALENTKVHQDTFIVTSGETYTQEETLRILAEELGVEPPSKKVAIPLVYGMLALDVLRSVFTGARKLRRYYVNFLTEDRVFDITKAKTVLGYSPKVSLRQGIRGYLQSQ